MLALILAAATTVVSAVTISDFATSPVDFNYPPARGYSADTASVYPCGGIEPGARSNYPLSGGVISLESQTLTANVNILYVNETDPALFHDFSTYTNSILDMSIGDYCTTAPDFIGRDYTAGMNVTLLVIYQFYGNNTYYYHCADITLVESSAYTAPSLTCTNSSIILKVADSDDSLVLNGGENFTENAAGDNGQTVSITSTPTAAATSSIAVSSSLSGSSSSAASASASSASSASSGSQSATSSKGVLSVAISTALIAFLWSVI